MRYTYSIFILLFALQNATAQMTTRVVRDSLFIPWELVYGQDNHIWFTQKNGYICRMEPQSGHIDTLYYETNTVIQAEGGMLGLVLHPSFSTDPYVYVAYNYVQNGYKERIVRYTYNSGNNTLSSPTTLLDNIPAANFHNGCRMVIVNNQLYATIGDATVTSTSQNVNVINGKTLRINLDGSIPTDNPIHNSPVWSWGHRNAQGLVYANGRFYSSEHGPQNDDELNIVSKGRNYGWPNVEGYCNTASEITFCNDSNVVEPIEAWSPTLAVSGIDYYDHPMFPSLSKSIIMATLKDEHLYQLKLNSSFDDVTTASIISQVAHGRLRDICISPSGSIFISTSNSKANGTSTYIDKIIELYDPNYTLVHNLTSEELLLNLYPNPATQTISLQSSIPLTFSYTIRNMLGQIVQNGTTIASNIIAIDALVEGIYVIQIYYNNESQKNLRFIKQ